MRKTVNGLCVTMGLLVMLPGSGQSHAQGKEVSGSFGIAIIAQP
jgi:hypothetical protein